MTAFAYTIRRAAGLAVSVLLIAWLAGCAGYSLVAPGRVVVNGSVSVEPTVAWNKIPSNFFASHVESWTRDGPLLNHLTFYAGIPDGQPIAGRQPTGSPPPPPLPVFRKTMGETEIAELFEATMGRGAAGTSFAYVGVKPATMGSDPGFLFEFTFTGRDQVDRQGLALGAVKNERLYLIVYIGTHLYHFGRDRAAVEALLASARLV